MGEYALLFNGTKITDVESGKLDSEVHYPLFGTIKPYISIERSALEKMMADGNNFHLKD